MKQYQKAQMIAKNLPTGSYAAGCPEKDRGTDVTSTNSKGTTKTGCSNCERTR